MGDFPLMTERGTFIINGTERVVVSQLVRSPGVYFERTPDKTSDKDIYTAKVIPSRGAWLEFEIDKRDMVGVRVDRKRKQSVTVLLKALGWTNDRIREEFGDYESMRLTLEKDHTTGQDDALLDIYRKLRPGEPPTRGGRADPARQPLLQPQALRPGQGRPLQDQQEARPRRARSTQSTLTVDDIVATIKYIVAAARRRGDPAGPPPRRGRRRARRDRRHRPLRQPSHAHVGELIQNQVRTGLSRMERVVRERMTTQDVEAITPQTLINIRPVVASIKEFFGTSQLSQFMDQNNPLAGLTHKRRLSALGPGGLSRDRAGMEVRDVHPSHYGRMCPIETPEGPNIGLIGSLASYGRINPFGFVETPYRKVNKGRVTDEVHYLTADDEDEHVIAQANATLNDDGTHFADERVLVRVKGGEVEYVPAVDVDYMDVSAAPDGVGRRPRSSRSSSTTTPTAPSWARTCSARPFRWCAPRRRSSAPAWSTAPRSTPVTSSSPRRPASSRRSPPTSSPSPNDDGTTPTYRIAKFNRSNQGTSYNQRVLVAEGDRVEVGSA